MHYTSAQCVMVTRQPFGSEVKRKEFFASSAYHVVLCVLGCTRTTLMYSTRAGTQMVDLVVALDMARSGEVLCFAYNNSDVDYVL